MTWTAYRIVFRLRSPLHVGHLKVGNLQRTRHYVPAKTLWGALTARLTRDLGRTDYINVGEQIKQEMAFGYFFPAIDREEPLYPNYTDNGLCHGSAPMSADEFAWRLLSSHPSTALDPQRFAAEEGSLHEVEFISASEREEGKQVYLIGHVFARDDCRLPWKDAIKRLQLGGERRYGWGRVNMQDLQPVKDLFNYPLEPEGARPVVNLDAGKPLLAHALLADSVPARGQIEPFLGRETNRANRFGLYLPNNVRICWVPGSKVETRCRLNLRLDGHWEL